MVRILYCGVALNQVCIYHNRVKRKFEGSLSSPHQSSIFLWLSEIVGICFGFLMDSNGLWKDGAAGQDSFSVFILTGGILKGYPSLGEVRVPCNNADESVYGDGGV